MILGWGGTRGQARESGPRTLPSQCYSNCALSAFAVSGYLGKRGGGLDFDLLQHTIAFLPLIFGVMEMAMNGDRSEISLWILDGPPDSIFQIPSHWKHAWRAV